METTWTITGTTPRFAGTCVACHEHIGADRLWSGVLVKDGKTNGVAHTHCAGGKFGGVQKQWRGPSTLTVEED